MSVQGKTWAKMKAKSERQKVNRAVRLVELQSKAEPTPILGLTAGQNPDTPHNSIHSEVFYIAGGDSFFVSPVNAQKSAPGERVRTTTPRSAIRKGLTWDEEDRSSYEAEVKARSASLDEKYDIDADTGARLKKSE